MWCNVICNLILFKSPVNIDNSNPNYFENPPGYISDKFLSWWNSWFFHLMLLVKPKTNNFIGPPKDKCLATIISFHYTVYESHMNFLSMFRQRCGSTTIVDKINVTLLQSPLCSNSMLINEWMRQREAEYFAKAPTTTNLQHLIGGKGGNGNIKSRFFGVTLSFVQDCLKIYEYCICYRFKDWD